MAAFVGDIIKAVYRAVTEICPNSTHGYSEIINYFPSKNPMVQLSLVFINAFYQWAKIINVMDVMVYIIIYNIIGVNS